MNPPRIHFKATRNGIDIRHARLKNAVDAHIKYSTAYAILDAVIAAGLDVEKYLKGEYDVSLLNQVVAWKNTSDRISVHQQDAVSSHKPKGK